MQSSKIHPQISDRPQLTIRNSALQWHFLVVSIGSQPQPSTDPQKFLLQIQHVPKMQLFQAKTCTLDIGIVPGSNSISNSTTRSSGNLGNSSGNTSGNLQTTHTSDNSVTTFIIVSTILAKYQTHSLISIMLAFIANTTGHLLPQDVPLYSKISPLDG